MLLETASCMNISSSSVAELAWALNSRCPAKQYHGHPILPTDLCRNLPQCLDGTGTAYDKCSQICPPFCLPARPADPSSRAVGACDAAGTSGAGLA